MKYISSWDSINESADIDRTFVRFGKLGLVKQDGFGSDTFHAPPAPRGFYAMPKRFQELFLVGSIENTQKIKNMPKEDKYKDPETGEHDWDKYERDNKKAFQKLRHEFSIDPTTEFWHHLDVPNNEVLQRHNSWVKTTFRAWKKALSKESVKLRAKSLAPWVSGKDDTEGEFRKTPGGINSTRKRTGWYSKDHFEVFFDTKVI